MLIYCCDHIDFSLLLLLVLCRQNETKKKIQSKRRYFLSIRDHLMKRIMVQCAFDYYQQFMLIKCLQIGYYILFYLFIY